MKITTIATIYIGSYEICLKIQELPSKKVIRDVENICCRTNVGQEIFTRQYIGSQAVDELCERLNEFLHISQTYQCDECLVYASNTWKYAENMVFVQDQIRIRTGLSIKVLNNSEQRYLSYKTVSVMHEFPAITQEGCALIDVGGRSLQVTLFEKGHMILTKQVPLGTLRVMRIVALLRSKTGHPENQILEMAEKEMDGFRALFGGNKRVKHVIMLGNYLKDVCRDVLKTPAEAGVSDSTEIEIVMSLGQFKDHMKGICKSSAETLDQTFDFINVNDPVFIPSMMMYYGLAKAFKADYIWVPGFSLNDGIAHQYAQQKKILHPVHDYEDDVLSCAREIARRYHSDEKHIDAMEQFALAVFDAAKKIHGMGRRERLLLRTAVYLHDCGKYVCLAGHGQMSYHIIMASELIGLNHRERKIIALAVKYHESGLDPYVELRDEISQADYMTVAKLAAILRLTNALDRSHKQKMQEFKVVRKDRELIITVKSEDHFYWEQAKFDQQADIFEKVFCLKPILKEKRV